MTSTSLTFDILARDKASSTFKHVGDSASKSSSHIAQFGAVLKKAAYGVGLLTAATGVFIVKAGVGYVDSLNKIQALSGANNKTMDATAKRLEANSGLYAKMGQSTGDAAGGVVELVKAGQSLSDAMKAVQGTMILAKAGELSVADASSVTANALNTFRLKASKAGDVANYLANAANISSADVVDLAESLKYVSPVAAAAGVSIQQTNAILAELANAGIKGSSAGTAFRTFLLNLQAPAAAGAAVLKDLGVQVFDATGKMKPLGEVIGQLGGKLNGLSQEEKAADLKAIFGKVGIAGATTILKQGADGLTKYTKGVEKAGAAQKLAEAKSKGLAGSFAIVRSAAISGAQSIYRQFSPLADKVLRPLAGKFATFAQNIGPALAKLGPKLKPLLVPLGHLAGIAWGKFTAGIGALKKLSTLDFSKLNGQQVGKQLGLIISASLNTLVSLSGKVGSALGEMFDKINWGELGRAAGKQIPLFMLGLATGILNFDPGPIFKFVGAHWFEVLIGVLTVAFAPAKFADPIFEVLSKIPFVGKFLAVSLRWLNDLGGKVKGIMADFARGFWKGFLEHATFPGAGLVRNVLRGMSKLPGAVTGKIRDLGETVYLKGLDAFERMGAAAGDAQSKILGKIGNLISKFLGPFKTIGTKIWSAVGDLGSVLWSKGWDVLKGFAAGAWQAAKTIVQAPFKWVTDHIPDWKGPIEKDRTLLRPAGRAIMDGLMDGIADRMVPLQTALGKVSDLIASMGDKISKLQDIRSGFMGTFSSDSVFGADLSQTTTDAAGNDVTTPGTAGDALAYQKQQAAHAKQLLRDIKRVTKMGLSKSLVRQLESQGASGEATLHALAAGSPDQIRQLNRLNKQTSQSLRAAGLRAGDYTRGGSINDDIRRAQRQDRVLERLEHTLHDLAESQKKGETIVVKIGDDAIIKAIRRYEHRKGSSSGSSL